MNRSDRTRARSTRSWPAKAEVSPFKPPRKSSWPGQSCGNRGCGYALADTGQGTRAKQDRLGHRSIEHSVRYTEPTPTRFKTVWR